MHCIKHNRIAMFGHVAEKCAVKIPLVFVSHTNLVPWPPTKKNSSENCATKTPIVIMSSGYWYRYPRLKIDTMRKVHFFPRCKKFVVINFLFGFSRRFLFFLLFYFVVFREYLKQTIKPHTKPLVMWIEMQFRWKYCWLRSTSTRQFFFVLFFHSFSGSLAICDDIRNLYYNVRVDIKRNYCLLSARRADNLRSGGRPALVYQ